MLKRVSFIAGLVSIVMSAPAVAAQEADPQIEIQVRDGSSRTRPARIVVPMPVEGASTVQTRIGSAHYRVSVHVEEGERRVLRFDLQRTVPSAETQDISLSVSVAPERGRRFVLARLGRPDGTETLVTARLTNGAGRPQRDPG